MKWHSLSLLAVLSLSTGSAAAQPVPITGGDYFRLSLKEISAPTGVGASVQFVVIFAVPDRLADKTHIHIIWADRGRSVRQTRLTTTERRSLPTLTFGSTDELDIEFRTFGFGTMKQLAQAKTRLKEYGCDTTAEALCRLTNAEWSRLQKQLESTAYTRKPDYLPGALSTTLSPGVSGVCDGSRVCGGATKRFALTKGFSATLDEQATTVEEASDLATRLATFDALLGKASPEDLERRISADSEVLSTKHQIALRGLAKLSSFVLASKAASDPWRGQQWRQWLTLSSETIARSNIARQWLTTAQWRFATDVYCPSEELMRGRLGAGLHPVPAKKDKQAIQVECEKQPISVGAFEASVSIKNEALSLAVAQERIHMPLTLPDADAVDYSAKMDSLQYDEFDLKSIAARLHDADSIRGPVKKIADKDYKLEEAVPLRAKWRYDSAGKRLAFSVYANFGDRGTCGDASMPKTMADLDTRVRDCEGIRQELAAGTVEAVNGLLYIKYSELTEFEDVSMTRAALIRERIGILVPFPLLARRREAVRRIVERELALGVISYLAKDLDEQVALPTDTEASMGMQLINEYERLMRSLKSIDKNAQSADPFAEDDFNSLNDEIKAIVDAANPKPQPPKPPL